MKISADFSLAEEQISVPDRLCLELEVCCGVAELNLKQLVDLACGDRLALQLFGSDSVSLQSGHEVIARGKLIHGAGAVMLEIVEICRPADRPE